MISAFLRPLMFWLSRCTSRHLVKFMQLLTPFRELSVELSVWGLRSVGLGVLGWVSAAYLPCSPQRYSGDIQGRLLPIWICFLRAAARRDHTSSSSEVGLPSSGISRRAPHACPQPVPGWRILIGFPRCGLHPWGLHCGTLPALDPSSSLNSCPRTPKTAAIARFWPTNQQLASVSAAASVSASASLSAASSLVVSVFNFQRYAICQATLGQQRFQEIRNRQLQFQIPNSAWASFLHLRSLDLLEMRWLESAQRRTPWPSLARRTAVDKRHYGAELFFSAQEVQFYLRLGI